MNQLLKILAIVALIEAIIIMTLMLGAGIVLGKTLVDFANEDRPSIQEPEYPPEYPPGYPPGDLYPLPGD